MNSKKLLSLLLVLSVVLAGLLPSTAVYASEVNTPGSAKSNAVLNSDGLIMDVTVPTSVLIYVDEHGEVTTPDYLPIINNSVAPVFVHSLSVTTENGWTLDPTNTDYTNFKVNQKNYWLSFNGLDPSIGPIALATPINGSDSLNLVLSAGVAPQKTAINGLNIGEIVITLDWDAVEGGEQGNQGDSGGNQEFGFSVEGASKVEPNKFKFTLNATETGYYFVAATLPDGTPPTDPLEYSLTDAIEVTEVGSKEYTVYFYPEEDWDEVDLYVWRICESGYEGPVKTTVRGNALKNYVMASTADFFGGGDNYMRYIGSDSYVIIPSTLKAGYETFTPTSYREMFKETYVKGVKSFNTGITNMSYMFYNHLGNSLELDDFNTSDVTNMASMFENYQGTTLNLGSFNTSKVTNMSSMFKSSLATSIDLSSFDTSSVENMFEMFRDSRASNLDLKHFNTSKVTNMSGMFSGSKATSIDVTSFDTSNVTDMSSMFSDVAVTELDLSSFDTSKVTDMRNMFLGYKGEILDLSSFDTSKVTVANMRNMFANTSATIGYARTQADADKFNASEGKPSGLTFISVEVEPEPEPEPDYPEGYVMATDSDFTGEEDGSFRYVGTAQKVIIPRTIKGVAITSYSGMFYNSGVVGVYSDNPDVTDMSEMFRANTSPFLDLRYLDISNVTNMDRMFMLSQTKTAYVATQEVLNTLNATSSKPASLNFVVLD